MVNSVCNFVWYRTRIGIYGNVYLGSRVQDGNVKEHVSEPPPVEILDIEPISRNISPTLEIYDPKS